MFRPNRQSRNAEVDFRGEKLSKATHASATDPDARLYKKSPGTGAMLCFIGYALMENRNGLIVQGDLTQGDGQAERRAALDMIHRHFPGSSRQLTLGADKGFDAAEFVADLRQTCVTPHVPQKARYSAIDGRTNRREGNATSQRNGKRIEEGFDWANIVGGMAHTSIAASPECAPASCSPWPLTTSPGCLGCWAHDCRGRRQAPTPIAPTNPTLNAAAHSKRKLFRLKDFFSSVLDPTPETQQRRSVFAAQPKSVIRADRETAHFGQGFQKGAFQFHRGRIAGHSRHGKRPEDDYPGIQFRCPGIAVATRPP